MMMKHRKMSRKYKRMPINRRGSARDALLRVGIVMLVIAVIVVALIFFLPRLYPGLSLNFWDWSSTGSSSSQAASSQEPVAPVSQAASSQEPATSVPEAEPQSISIIGAGENFIHDGFPQRRVEGQPYDYAAVYARVKGLIEAQDIAVVNQATVLAEKIAPISGYPLFNSPTETGDALVSLGFDVISMANNHALDKGAAGITATLDYWDKQPAKTVGAYRSAADAENITLVEKNGIKTAHIGVAEVMNKELAPKDSPIKIVMADDRELLERLVKKAKAMADVVVTSVSWGDENTQTVTTKQKELAQDLVDWGADIILGSHPHALQPLTLLTRASDGASCPVAYSLGNFVSAQAKGINLLGGLLNVKMTRDDATGKVLYDSMQLTPIVTQYDKSFSNISIYPLSDYNEALAQAHGVRAGTTPQFCLDYLKTLLYNAVAPEYLAK